MKVREFIAAINATEYRVLGDLSQVPIPPDSEIKELVGAFWLPDGTPGGIVSLKLAKKVQGNE